MDEQNDLESHEKVDPGKGKMKVTRINVFDHIRKRSKRLQALPCLGSAPIPSRFDQMHNSTSCHVVKTSSDAQDGPAVNKFKHERENDVLCPRMASSNDSVMCIARGAS
jgi:hypothetical protein